MADTRVAILGGGPAGVGAAYQLRRLDRAVVTLFEQGTSVGGNAGSFEVDGHILDYGSHRLHPACDPGVLADIRAMLGDDLLVRPRHGRIRLRGRWIHFPLKPLDLAFRLDPAFAAGTARDVVRKVVRRRAPADGADANFATVMEANLGETICRDFYFPFARKIWGAEPETLSAIQARRRVSASSFGKLARKVIAQVPGLRQPLTGRFFYPRGGFGQISRAYADAAARLGADVRLGWRITCLTPPADPSAPWVIEATHGADRRVEQLEFEHIWSTLPVTVLASLMSSGVPDAVGAARAQIRYRAMLLVYLELDVDRFTEFDAHYFPGADIAITRLSETKNYAARTEPLGRTMLCAELPCSTSDSYWSTDDAALGRLVAENLARAGLTLATPPRAVHVRRLPFAYPIYDAGYEVPFGVLDDWVEGVPRLLSYGRQGLFAHDNTHHALYMAYAAADCLDAGVFDAEKWGRYRRVFATHVVED